MTVELDRLRSLASVIGAAEDQLAVARWTLRETAMALLRCGDATLAEITRASGVEQGQLRQQTAVRVDTRSEYPIPGPTLWTRRPGR
jgi:hypothetical protein